MMGWIIIGGFALWMAPAFMRRGADAVARAWLGLEMTTGRRIAVGAVLLASYWAASVPELLMHMAYGTGWVVSDLGDPFMLSHPGMVANITGMAWCVYAGSMAGAVLGFRGGDGEADGASRPPQ